MINPSNVIGRSLSDWLSYLEHQHPVTIDLGLTRIRQVAQLMSLDTMPMPVVTVAGTNGKGSTCRLIEQLLLAKGYSVGVYSSPHISDYRERVRINDKLLEADLFCQAFSDIEQARGNITLTYFEVSTLAALWLFKRQNLDYVILEVGLGGRLDATNIIDADVAVVTTIALDHENYLGHDLQQIGREKAGIFRAQGKAVIGDPSIVESVYQSAEQLGCQLLANGHQVHAQISNDGQSWCYQGLTHCYAQLPMPELPIDNAVAAFAVLDQLQITLSESQAKEQVAHWQLAGRMQLLQRDPIVYIDVAHNPQSAQYLATQLIRHPCQGNTFAVCAMLADKDNQGAVDALDGLFEQWFIAGLANDRGDNGDKLVSALYGKNYQRYANIHQAYEHALLVAKPIDRIIIFGSFVTVAEVLAIRGG
ncbi:bifunctional tetrahydrofolate synthase/dihydrofolate synthase [Celerinatantimonas yamalensis]|uniref:Dihydrofolate synthase/folylpolyglutamate synthase n=1 Tax=Celerinatantimonas yamalensis TaxID=559956 RepID=A0ABW9G299_9GAMM